MGGVKWGAMRQMVQWMDWESRRRGRQFVRGFGWPSVMLVVCAGIASAALVVAQQQEKLLNQLQAANTGNLRLSPVPTILLKEDSGRMRLHAFDAYLLLHDEIPDTLKNLIALAEDMKLTLSRGEYKAQMETQGEYFRYGMALPVKGDAQAIHMFILTALATNRTLILEDVQFKRDRIESPEIEARIQWALLTRLPAHSPSASGPATGATVSGSSVSRDLE